MADGTKMFTCDKFLGLNEGADGSTELNMGEASRMENWTITDGLNLAVRPGIRRLDLTERGREQILASWAGYIGDTEYLVICDFKGRTDRLWVYQPGEDGVFLLRYHTDGALGLSTAAGANVKFFPFAGNLYCMSSEKTVVIGEDKVEPAKFYIPLVITGSAPAGGGKTLENLNQLTSQRRIDYSADGQTKAYVLPAEATAIIGVAIDNVAMNVATAGTFDTASQTYTFKSAPIKGVGNVEITYDTDHAETEATRKRLAAMRLTEAYNGSTDTRLFMAGDGTNICFYTGVPMSGDLTQLYFPAMNEIAVDMSNSPVTGLVRHYSKLLIFKPDGVYSISYEAVTLPGGDTIAGFYLRNVNKEYGNDGYGQIQTVNNYPRSISGSGVYEWRITSANYKDERYAQRISDRVQKTLEKAEAEKIVSCDDDFMKSYFLFLNDYDGTVLVNRYGVTREGVWMVYRSQLFRQVHSAFMVRGEMVFCGERDIFYFHQSETMDAPLEPEGEALPIYAVWESGALSFGADFRRKFSSQLYISLHPSQSNTMKVTAQTDRRDEYMVKEIRETRFFWPNANFADWSFILSTAPKINRVRLKVKKFVYYKLIFIVDEPGAVATVLGYDQQVRFSSMAK